MSTWSDRCECTWKFHSDGRCTNTPADHGSVVMSPSYCVPCLYVCCAERDDERDQRVTDVELP